MAMFEDLPIVNVDYGKKTCVQAAFIPKTRTILPFFIAITNSRFADKIHHTKTMVILPKTEAEMRRTRCGR